MLVLLVIGLICIIFVAPDILFWPFLLFSELNQKTNSVRQGSERENNKNVTVSNTVVLAKRSTTVSGSISSVDEAFSSIRNNVSSFSWDSWNDNYDEEEDELESEIYDEVEGDAYWMEDDCIPGFKLFDDDQNDDSYDDWDRYEDSTESDDITYFFNGLGEPMTSWDGNGNFSGGPFSGI